MESLPSTARSLVAYSDATGVPMPVRLRPGVGPEGTVSFSGLFGGGVRARQQRPLDRPLQGCPSLKRKLFQCIGDGTEESSWRTKEARTSRGAARLESYPGGFHGEFVLRWTRCPQENDQLLGKDGGGREGRGGQHRGDPSSFNELGRRVIGDGTGILLEDKRSEDEPRSGAPRVARAVGRRVGPKRCPGRGSAHSKQRCSPAGFTITLKTMPPSCKSPIQRC